MNNQATYYRWVFPLVGVLLVALLGSFAWIHRLNERLERAEKKSSKQFSDSTLSENPNPSEKKTEHLSDIPEEESASNTEPDVDPLPKKPSLLRRKVRSMVRLLSERIDPSDPERLVEFVEELESLRNEMLPNRPEAIAEITEWLQKEEDENTRYGLFSTLSHLGGVQAFSLLNIIARDAGRSEEDRANAITALGQFNPIGLMVTPQSNETQAIMLELSNDPSPKIRKSIAYSLGSTDTPTSRNILHSLVQDEEDRIAVVALQKLEMVGDETSLPHLFVTAQKHERLRTLVNRVGASIAARTGTTWTRQ